MVRLKLLTHYVIFIVDDTVCFRKQIEFDKSKEDGTLGHLMQRPSCDGDGFFSPIICIPGEMYVFFSFSFNI